MGRHVIRCSLTEQSIHDAIKELDRYKNSLPRKMERFVILLAKQGVSMAVTTARSGRHFGRLISFGMRPNNTDVGVEYILYATSADENSRWYVTTPDGQVTTREYAVSPMLMEEYGSGNYAIPGFTKDGDLIGGLATLNVYGHALQNSWSFATRNENGRLGGWVTSSGYAPTRPMYHAQMEMINIVESCARQAFGGD